MERTLAEGLATELNDRAAVQETMARLELGETPEETAQLLCEALATFQDVDEVLLQHLPPADGPAVLIGVAGDMAKGRQIGDTVDPGLAADIRLRATGGAWSSQQPGVPSLPRLRGEDPAGVTVVAAPVRHRGRPIAVLYLGSCTTAPDAWIARHLRIASELAAHVGPMLGPPLARRDTVVSSADDVARIIANGAYTPFFQPICDLGSGLAVGWESLTRFDDGVPPSRRFADAHAIGLGLDLELACGSRAVEAFAALGHPGWLSVNLSPSLVLSGRADELVATARQPIVLEFTESVAAPDFSRLRQAIDHLRAPAMIAVDEAGAGYSGLRKLLELRPDFVKLDLGLVHEIDRDTARQALIAGMVHYATQAGAQLIAEGVEADVERRTLLRLGVRLGQGHLLGTPSASGDLTAPTAAAPDGAGDSGARVAMPSRATPT
jgi:EAL domain-containing protein (putative c-di-GMP-specific phosphodiesterase class I)